jgi:hypothetical protein
MKDTNLRKHLIKRILYIKKKENAMLHPLHLRKHLIQQGIIQTQTNCTGHH